MIYPLGMSLSYVIYTLVSVVYFRYNVHDLPTRNVSILCISYTLVFVVYFRYNVHDLPTRNVFILCYLHSHIRCIYSGTMYMIYPLGMSLSCVLVTVLIVPLLWPLKLTSSYEVSTGPIVCLTQAWLAVFLLHKVRISYPNMAILFGSLFSVLIY